MDITIKEQQVAEFCRKDLLEENQNQLIKVYCLAGRDIRVDNDSLGIYFYDESLTNILCKKGEFTTEYFDGVKELLIYKADNSEIYSDLLITLYPDGNYQFKYWFDENRVYKNEFYLASLRSQRFPHSIANDLICYDLPAINFKKKYSKIVLTLEIKAGAPVINLQYRDGRNQIKPVFNVVDNSSQPYKDNIDKILKLIGYGLLHQYNITNGILKEFWEPWNKIIIEVPPSGILNELEDIHYYLNDTPLDKKYFTRGYFDMEKWEYVKYK